MLVKGALTGIRVVDLSRMLPGPYCSMILADHGAEVVAIENRAFEGDGLFYPGLNRNKRHMTLNLKSEEGREIFFRLADRADVIIEGFRPGVVKRLGVDYQTVRQRNPRGVYCSITGYGQSGPLSQRAGHDINYISEAGVLGLIGEKGGRPVIPGVQLADIAGGSMNAVVGILLALLAREKTGEGQYIDISMTDGLLGMLSLPAHFYGLTGKVPEVSNSLLSHRYACYNTYETADGRFIAIGALEGKFWQRLCDQLERPQYGPLQYDEDQKVAMIEDFRQIFRGRTMAHWQETLGGLEVCFSVVKNFGEVLNDSHFRHRQMVGGDDPAAAATGFGIPVRLSATPGTVRSHPAGFGGDTRQILADLGYSTDQIDGFYEQGVV